MGDKKKLKKILKVNFNHVVNLAGYVDHSNKSQTYKSHYLGCVNLANALINKKLIHLFKWAAVLSTGKKSPHNELMKCNPISIYAKSKYLSSRYLLDLNKNYNFPAVIFRLYQTYGGKQDNNRLIPITISNCLNGKQFPCSKGNQKRDFLFIDDLTRALFLAMSKKKVEGIFSI